jgi:membrane associated rhomboid family serine protease
LDAEVFEPQAPGEQQQQQEQEVVDQEDVLIAAMLQQEMGIAATMAGIKQDLASMWPPWGAKQQRQQQETGAAAAAAAASATATTAAAAAAAAAQQQQQQQQQPLGGSSRYSPGDRLAAALQRSFGRLSARLSGAKRRGPEGQQEPEQPLAAPLVVAATWAVFLLEWAPVLPSIWAQASSGAPQHLLAPLLTSPGTQATMALVADGVAVLDGRLHLLATAGLLHGGLLPLLWSTDGILDASTPLELSFGPLTTLVLLATCAAGASLFQTMVCGQQYVLAGVGAMAGAYAALFLAALRDQNVLLVSPKGLLYLLLSCCWAWYHPLVGLGSVAGGVLGGAAGLYAAPWLAAGLKVAVALPLLLALGAARLAWQLLAILAALLAQVAKGTAEAVMETVRTVRNL